MDPEGEIGLRAKVEQRIKDKTRVTELTMGQYRPRIIHSICVYFRPNTKVVEVFTEISQTKMDDTKGA